MRSFYTLFLLFISYSLIGWVVEMLYVAIRDRHVVNRGFLIGPIIPIYGCGGILMNLILADYVENPVALFVISIIFFSFLEYFTSFFMEKLFHTRWWDYSKRKFNINGRICLETMLPFGFLGLACVYFIQPLLLRAFINMPDFILIMLFWPIFLLFLADVVVSLIIINKYKHTVRKIAKDSTEEISLKARRKFLEGNLFRRRLMRAFPNVETRYERLKKLQKDINKKLQKLQK